jgi:signal transduction histidine kinase
MTLRRLPGDPPAADVGLALALFAIKVTFVLTGTLMSGGVTPMALVTAAVLTLPLAWRRRAPLTVAVIVAAAIAGDDLVAGWNAAVLSFDCSIIAAYSAGANAAQRHAAAALAALTAANIVDAMGAPGNLAGNLALGIVVFSLVPWLVGQALRRERRRTSQLEELAASLAAERDRHADLAVAAERGRIARELHDIVGHAISVIAVQADAAARLLPHDPSRVAGPLETIQTTSRGALAEMRRLVGLLRVTDAAELEPAPGLADLEQLADEARRSGLPVTVDLIGESRPLPATLDLAAYRIVQEGLTNVRKHARDAEAKVTVSYSPASLGIEVHDNGGGNGTPTGTGYGLIGIKERVALLGGELESGPAAGGGFTLRATLPLEEPAG